MNIFLVVYNECADDWEDFIPLKYSDSKLEAEKFMSDLNNIISSFKEVSFKLKTKELEVAKFLKYKELCLEYNDDISHLKEREDSYTRELIDFKIQVENINNKFFQLNINDLSLANINSYDLKIFKVESI